MLSWMKSNALHHIIVIKNINLRATPIYLASQEGQEGHAGQERRANWKLKYHNGTSSVAITYQQTKPLKKNIINTEKKGVQAYKKVCKASNKASKQAWGRREGVKCDIQDKKEVRNPFNIRHHVLLTRKWKRAGRFPAWGGGLRYSHPGAGRFLQARS